MLTDKQKGLLCGLIYVAQFEDNPALAVNRAIMLVIERDSSATLRDYSAAITNGLGSTDELAKLIPQSHSEPVIRNYLAQIQRELDGSAPKNIPPNSRASKDRRRSPRRYGLT